MSRPVGSKNKPKGSEIIHPIQSTITDDYAQAWTGAGTRKDRSTTTRHRGALLLQQRELESLYIGDGFARRIVDIPAEDMTRSGLTLENLDDAELEEYVESRFDELDAMRHFNDAVRWSRLHGGAVMIFGINDGGTLDVPLNPEGIKSVEFIRVYDRWQAIIDKRVSDPESEYYGQPEMWQISPAAGGMPYKVHDSRLHVFDGESLPDQLRQNNQGWGGSVLQSCVDQLTRLGMGHQWTNMLLERNQQAVHSIPNMASTLNAPGGEKAIQRRVDVVDMVRSILNTIVIDAAESYTVSTQSLSGIPDVLDRFAEALAAVAGFPVSKLMGRAPGGLNANGKGDDDTWNARMKAMWNDILRKPQDRLITYLMIAKTGESPPYKLCMNPLTVLSDAEQATIEKTKAECAKLKAETAQIYLLSQVVFVPEIRAGLEDEYQLDKALDMTQEEIDQALEDDKEAESQAAIAAAASGRGAGNGV